jgi:hypothetical protein
MQLSLKPPTPFRGAILAAAAIIASAFGQTGLTTIQDTLFKADGTRFTGTLTIQWNTFDAANIGTVVQQSRSVPVVNGNLQVQLVPNAGAQSPANSYVVHYQSDGSQQFTETWTVPTNVQAMSVAQVRTATLSGTGSTGTAGNQTPIVESAVIGLTADLAVRPIEGPGFGTGSVAVINQNGQIETAVGNSGDCVYVDGTAGPCGSQTAVFFDAETPGGLVDGINTTFTLANPPSGSSLMLFRNGLYMTAAFDYTLSASSLTFVAGAPPQPGDTLIASYRLDPSAGNIGALQGGPGQLHNTVVAQVLCGSNGRSTSQSTWSTLGTCNLTAAALRPGDRIEIRFNFAHTGTASGFDIEIDWGATKILSRHAGTRDAAVAGQVESAMSAAGAQITVQSWGTVLTFLPVIVTSPVQQGLTINLKGIVSTAGSDALSLASFTVLRYPGF